MKQLYTENFVPVPASNGTVEGSGAEDIGFHRHEARTRIEENRNHQAEIAARNRRLDCDRLVATAIYYLVLHCDGDTATIADVSGLQTSANVMELIAEIRSELSPIATGRA